MNLLHDIILEDKDVDYLLFFNQEPDNWCYFHLVEAYIGSQDFYEFGDEIYSLRIWCAGPEFAHNLLYLISNNVGQYGFAYLHTLYQNVGGSLREGGAWTPYSILPN